MRGSAWTLNKEQARAAQRRPSLAALVLRFVSPRAWSAGYDAALAELAAGRLREHISGATRPKRSFPSGRAAMAFASSKGHQNVCSYKCGVCGDWHLATVRR